MISLSSATSDGSHSDLEAAQVVLRGAPGQGLPALDDGHPSGAHSVAIQPDGNQGAGPAPPNHQGGLQGLGQNDDGADGGRGDGNPGAGLPAPGGGGGGGADATRIAATAASRSDFAAASSDDKRDARSSASCNMCSRCSILPSSTPMACKSALFWRSNCALSPMRSATSSLT